jgi:hypothetical protein
LLVAKLHKIGERADHPSRHDDKDALDVLRLCGMRRRRSLLTLCGGSRRMRCRRRSRGQLASSCGVCSGYRQLSVARWGFRHARPGGSRYDRPVLRNPGHRTS